MGNTFDFDVKKNPTVLVQVRVNIHGTVFTSTVDNMHKAIKVVDALCNLNQPPQVFVCVGNGTYKEVALSDFV